MANQAQLRWPQVFEDRVTEPVASIKLNYDIPNRPKLPLFDF